NELLELIDLYKTNYPDLITRVKLEKNIGLGLALNEGLKACRNELVGRMDTDDISLANRFELQLKRFEKKEKLVILGTQNLEFDQDYTSPTTQRKVPENYHD